MDTGAADLMGAVTTRRAGATKAEEVRAQRADEVRRDAPTSGADDTKPAFMVGDWLGDGEDGGEGLC